MTRFNSWRFGAWLLVLALVLAQQLGLMHRVSHGPLRTHPVDVSAVRTVATPDKVDSIRSIASLFSGHGSDSSCRLFDANGQGAAPAVALLVLPTATVAGVIALFQLATVAFSPALFEARGPPSFR